MWHWLTAGQFSRLEEVILSGLLLGLGLFTEDWIDRYRDRKRK